MAEALGAKVSSLDATLTGAVVDDFERRLWIFFIETIEKHGPISAVAIEKPLVPNHERKKTVIDTSSEWAGKAVRKEIVAGTKQATNTRLKTPGGTARKTLSAPNNPWRNHKQTTLKKDFTRQRRPRPTPTKTT